MKKISMILLFAGIAIGTFSCTTDMIAEEPFIEVGGGSGGASGNPYWDWADKFPGPVSPLIERASDVQFTVKGGYEALAFAPGEAVLQSTGYYVASADEVRIVVPEGTANLEYQIGIGYEIPESQLHTRYKNVVTRGALHPGENTISSYFGGFLYLCYPAGKVPSDDVTVMLDNVVPSDNYVQGTTDMGEWFARMAERAGLLATPPDNTDSLAFLNWTEMSSDKVILTAGVGEMSALTDPNRVLDYYGKMVDAYYWFGGYDPAGQPPVRIYSDMQLPDPKQTVQVPAASVRYYGSYPIGYLRGKTTRNFEDEKKLLNLNYLQAQLDGTNSFYGVLYGFGQGMGSPWMQSDLLLAPMLNVGYYHYAQTLGLWPGTTVDFVANTKTLNKELYFLWLDTDYNPSLDVQYITDGIADGRIYGRANVDTRTTLFMHLAQWVGWGIFPYISERARELDFKYEEDPTIGGQSACDFFAMSAAEYCNRNLMPFFNQWNFPVTAAAAQYIKNFPDLGANEKFWTSYNVALKPSFDKKTANKSFSALRPKAELTYTEITDKSKWYLRGVHYDRDKYRASYGAVRDTVKAAAIVSGNVTRNSIDNPVDMGKAIDGKTDGLALMMNNARVKPTLPITGLGRYKQAHFPYYTLSFVGPEARPADKVDLDPETGLPITYPQQATGTPITFNTFSLWNGNLAEVADNKINFTNCILEIEYFDDASGTWKSTEPSGFLLQRNKTKFEYYYFEKTYTTTHVRFRLQSISPGIGDASTTGMVEMGFGLVKHKN